MKRALVVYLGVGAVVTLRRAYAETDPTTTGRLIVGALTWPVDVALDLSSPYLDRDE